MAFTLFGERKKQKYLVFALVTIISLALLFACYKFLIKPGSPPAVPPITPFKKVEINFTFLESEILKEFSVFGRVPDIQEEFGRENPFVPY